MKIPTSPCLEPVHFRRLLIALVIVVLVSPFFSCKKNVADELNVLDPTHQNRSTDSVEFNYSVYFCYKDSSIAGYIGQLYTDSAEFDMRIVVRPDPGQIPDMMAVASISNIHNHNPTVLPVARTYTLPDGEALTWTWIPDTVGMYDIDSAYVVNPVFQEDSLIDLVFTNDKGITAAFTGLQEPGDIGTTIPSIVLGPGQEISPNRLFRIDNNVQEIGNPNQGFYFRMTPKPE